MKTMLKMELTRAFRNKFMLFSLIVGNGIVIMYYIFSVRKTIDAFYININSNQVVYQLSSYNCWIGLSLDIYSLLYFFIIPILAAIPYGASLFLDKKDGYINNILIKTDRKKYFLAKLITFFISGGVIATVPLVLSYILAIISLPSLRPYVEASQFSIRDFSIFNGIFYSNYTFVYIVIFIVFDFILFGLINCLCMVFTYWEDNRFAILLTPFIICYGMQMLGNYYIGLNLSPLMYSKINLLLSDQFIYIIGQLLVLVLLALASLRGAKKDVI